MEIEDAHKLLLLFGYTYTGQTCGCGGSAKKRTYNKTDNKVIINLRTKQYTHNNELPKPIQELTTNL
jgi:hypothetical protein